MWLELIMRQKLIYFYAALYIGLRMLSLGEIFFSDVVGIASNEQWLRFSDSQKVDILLFGSSRLSNEENVEIFSHVQQLLRSVQTLSFNLNVKSIF